MQSDIEKNDDTFDKLGYDDSMSGLRLSKSVVFNNSIPGPSGDNDP